MKSKLVPLYELGEIVSGSTPDTTNMEYWDGNIPWITPADLTGHQGIFFTGELRKITDLGYKNCSTKIIPPGSILYSSRAPIGHCAVTTFPLCTNQGFKNLIPNRKLNPIYGYFALKYFTPQIEFLGRGATFTEINKELFENVCIPLPPLPEQQRIAAILQKADRLRRLRRYARQLSDGYLQSVFLEMFGDPKSNPKKWKKGRIDDISLLVTDGEHITPNRTFSGIKLLSARNIQNGYIDFEAGIDFISVEEYDRIKKRCNPEFEDILISCSGSVGRVTTIRTHDPFTLVRSVALIKPDKKQIQPYYLEHFLRTEYSQEMIERYSKASSQANLFQGPIKELPVLVPSMSEQNRFVECVKKYYHTKKISIESDRQSEMLFQTLLQRAFQGEL